MEVKEHFYADDPSRGPADARTTLRDVEYFFLGNGLIQAAVQIAPAGDGTPVGLLLLDPERFGPKRAALSFDPESGITATMVTLEEGRRRHAPRPGAVRAAWRRGPGEPRVEVVWRSGPYRVTEHFSCPDMRSARLVRRVAVARTEAGPARIRLRTGLRDRPVEIALPVNGRSAAEAAFEYCLARRGGRSVVTLRPVSPSPSGTPAAAFWKETASFRSSDPDLDRFFAASKYQLRAAVSAAGRLDGSVWQYNLEWVRDQALVALALAMAGMRAPARTILARLLSDFVGDEGETVDSSRFRRLEESEVDQNGVLLFALEAYVRWTGDEDLVRTNWAKISKAADFPLRPEFRHGPSGLIVNRREYWERHGAHGLAVGMELAHQLFVALGLGAAGRLAERTGRTDQARAWTAAAMDLRRAMLQHPRFSLVEAGAFIKRRGLDGRVQAQVRPEPDSSLPRTTPLFGPGRHYLNPDTAAVLPVAWEFVGPAGRLARKTLAAMETLWNQRWRGGGYGRYHVTSEPDSPGPWPFASLFVARAALEAGEAAKTRRVLDWLAKAPGGRAASWFEFYGPRPVPPYPQVGIVPWTWAEVVFLVVHGMLGVRPGEDCLSLRPRLIPRVDRMEADLPLRDGHLELSVRRARQGEEPHFRYGGKKVPYHRDGIGLALPRPRGRVAVRAVIP